MKIHNHGMVKLIDSMGDDKAIVDAARTSYDPSSTKHTRSDEGLIRYLMRHKHTTPFEMVEFKFFLKMPIFVARQWIRHRTASINEFSGRYSIMPEEFFIPAFEDVVMQSQVNRQGGGAELPVDVQGEVVHMLKCHGEEAFHMYERLWTGWPWFDSEGNFREDDPEPHTKAYGMSRELARINLPLSTYTQFYWKINLHNLLHFLKLRTDSHAQKQIRDYAEPIERIVSRVVPMAYQAWLDYSKNAYNMSSMEMELIRHLLSSSRDSAEAHILSHPTMKKSEKEEMIKALFE